MKACIFVDGENFRHSIVDLFDKFQREDYLPKTADWTGLRRGDEFSLLVSGESEASADVFTPKIRKVLEDLVFGHA